MRSPTRIVATACVIAACSAVPPHKHVPASSPGPAAALSPARATLRYEGTGQLEGHFRAPGEVRPFSLALDLVLDGPLRQVVVTTWTSPDASEADREVTWIDSKTGTVVQERGTSSAPRFVALTGLEALWARQLAALGAEQAARPVAHPNLGDVLDRVVPGATSELDGVAAPSSLELAHHSIELSWAATLRRVPPRTAAASTQLAMPAVTATPPTPPQRLHLEPIAAGVFLASVPEGDTASLIVELDDGLFVAETTLTTTLGEQLVDELATRFPGKPIRHVSFSHYHPHYTGGLRAFVAAGAEAIAPPGLAAYARAVLARRFTLAPDRLARAPRPAKVQTFTASTVVGAPSGRRVELWDLGAASNHTEEYVVVYVPHAKLLFQGDLGWFQTEDGSVRSGRRASGMLEALRARGVPIERVAQGWPLMPGKQVLTRQELEAAVAARRP